MASPSLIFGNETYCNRNHSASLFSERFNFSNSVMSNNTSLALSPCDTYQCLCPFERPIFGEISNFIQHLAYGLTFFNIVAHLVSAIVFLDLIRGRDLAQQNHHLLFILSIFEMLHAFFSVLKLVLSYADAIVKPKHSFDSVLNLKVSYYMTMLLQMLTSTSYFCRNWWLVVIALTRSVTVVRLQRILKNADGVHSSGIVLMRVNKTAVVVVVAGLLVALLVHGVIVPLQLAIYLCSTNDNPTLWTDPQDMTNRIRIVDVKVINSDLPSLVRVLVILLHELLVLILPIIIMAAATVVIWVSLRRLSRGPCMVPNQRMQMMSRVTRLIAILLTVFVILEPLSPICFLLRKLIRRRCIFRGINFLLSVGDLLGILDSTTNLVVYYLWDKSFRHNLQKYFRRRCPKCNSRGILQRGNRRDTFPTTNHAGTAPTALTYANVTNVASTTMRDPHQGNLELQRTCTTVQPLLKPVEDEEGFEEEEEEVF